MVEYQYSKLVDEARDIRLLLLRPGQFDDNLKVAIAHVSLPEPVGLPNQQAHLADVRKTLPIEWQVFQSVDGRHIFEHAESASTTWTHPNSSVSSYNKVRDIPNESFRPIYEALSYTWGTTENPTRLYVESDEPLGPLRTLKIQQNLAIALKHLRHSEVTRTLWVDAVCINQDSISERNSQVTRMTSIYRSAYTVVVWLGLESSDSKVALSALNEIGSQTVLTKCARRVRNPDAYHPDWFSGESNLPYGEDVWRAILALINRPWFDRVWVVQEIQLANFTATIQRGNDLISWGRLRTAAWCIFRKLSSPYPLLTRRLAAIKILLVSLEELNFRHLLYGSSSRLCTDQRDHVYGLLGLASAGILSEIQPQYSSDVGNTYTSAFLAILRQSQRLDALADCGLESVKFGLITLPSWVPNWNVPIEEQVGVLNSLYSGTGRSSAEATFLAPNILEVTGVPSGIIDIVKSPALRDSSEYQQAIWDWAPKDIRKGIYPTGENVSAAYALSLSLGMVLERFPAAVGIIPSLQDLQKDLEDFAELSQCQSDGSPPSTFRQMFGTC